MSVACDQRPTINDHRQPEFRIPLAAEALAEEAEDKGSNVFVKASGLQLQTHNLYFCHSTISQAIATHFDVKRKVRTA
jgi:hypothetical protein